MSSKQAVHVKNIIVCDQMGVDLYFDIGSNIC